ncbi:MAG: hypothetical protein GEV10_25640 [Streptosporangiales bacterium]|nr:hypothetical protein [Streptosporangiales bacterium]
MTSSLRRCLVRVVAVACCVVAVAAAVVTLVVAPATPAHAAAPAAAPSPIPTPPGAKPSPGPGDDPCRFVGCSTPTVTATPDGRRTAPSTTPNGGTPTPTPGTSQTQQAKAKGGGSEEPPDYFGQLTDQKGCVGRPHVIAPRSAGKAAGHCIPVSSFAAMYEATSPSAGASWKCFVPFFQGSCGSGTKNAGVDSATEEALGTQFGFVWGMYQMVVNLAAWFTQWGVSFQPLAVVSDLAGDLQRAWDAKVIDRLHLGGFGGFVLMLAALWAGLLMLFRRFRRGFAELMVAVLIAVIGAAFLLHPGTTINKSINTARYFGLTVAVISLDPGGSPTLPTSAQAANRIADQQVGRAVSDKLVTSVLVKPHMIANTGKVQKGACERQYWEMLDAKGEQQTTRYEQFTKEGGCVTAGALRPSVERILMASLLLIMAILIALFCLLAVGLLLLSQLAAAVYIAVAGLVWTVAPLPGWGRSILVKWITGLLVCIAGTIAGVLVVVVYLDVLGVILGLGEAPLVNFALALIVAVAGFMLRKKLTAGLRNGARQIGAKLEGSLSRPGGETMVETQQRKQTGLAPLPVATAVADGGGAPGGDPAGAVGGQRADLASGVGGRAKPFFSERVRNAVGQSKQGKLALSTTAGAGRAGQLAGAAGSAGAVGGTSAAGGAALGAPGIVALGAVQGAQAAGRTARKVKGDVIDSTTGGGNPASGERATRIAGRAVPRGDGSPSRGGSPASERPSSNRAQELIAEMQRRRAEREQELLRRQLS